MAFEIIFVNGHNKEVTRNNLSDIEHDNVDAYVREYVTGIIKPMCESTSLVLAKR